MASSIKVEYGIYQFASGYVPQAIRGPDRDMYVVEHQVPGREGGVNEYLGSRQPAYSLRGFLSPPMGGPYDGVAGAALSGTSYVGLNADLAKDLISNLRGSGAQLLRIESTVRNRSGYAVLYENDFFYMSKLTIAYEAGHAYPYYPYSMELRGASTKTFGQSSGTGTYFPAIYFSGYVHYFTWRSGFYTGAPVIALGFYAQSVASGNARMAIYNQSGPQGTSEGLVVQTASQPVHSGWNYFPIRPLLLTMASGNFYALGFMGDATNASGYVLSYQSGTSTSGWTSGTTGLQSGIIYNSGFPDPLAGTLRLVSGMQLNLVMVTV